MDSNAPTVTPTTDPAVEMLAAAAEAYETSKIVRRNAARAAQASGMTYRSIAAALNTSASRVHELVNGDAA